MTLFATTALALSLLGFIAVVRAKADAVRVPVTVRARSRR